jgi:hypothetical protein
MYLPPETALAAPVPRRRRRVQRTRVPGWGRRIDILGVDKDGDYVVIELKVSCGHERTIGQFARYMGCIWKNLAGETRTRGMIVASKITEDLKLAAAVIPNVSLVEYQMTLTFRPVVD